MALNEHNYIPLTETQLGLCDKMQGYTRRYTYNQLQVRPDNGKHR